ncbi:hypothetical protein Dsin_010609 [Dipteronia sinensis]|uniref:Uncharacterized protein n=1 Tax=Dipteronia sinensis TaxID=43782 RepID=A0AAE0ED00_9ROSI|nr:hypothetical protein Dsin_010609 [Dipteronia sinensis]
MDLPNLFKNLFHSTLAMFIQLLPAPPSPAIPVDHEAAEEHHPEPEPEPVEMFIHRLPAPTPPPAIPVDLEAEAKAEAALLANYGQETLDWAVRMIGFCLPPAVAIAVQFLKTDQSHELPLAFYFLSLALILSFNFLFLTKFIAPKFPETAKLLERFGVFLAVTAIYIAVTIPLPLWLKCIIWIVFVISCITILFCYGLF